MNRFDSATNVRNTNILSIFLWVVYQIYVVIVYT